MRLTLRTMLAYLDDVLDPTDAQELAAKIEESRVATDLIKRIRTSTRSLHLKAPPLDGPGAVVDSNTVAEYLDSTLAPERMSKVDSVCMESDSYLAEVASCHQILALVLGQPLHLEPSLRERIYGISGASAEGEDVSPPPFAGEQQGPKPWREETPSTTDGVAVEGKSAKEKIAAPPKMLRVPDYLRSGADGGIRTLPMVLTIVASFLVVAVGLRALGPFNSQHPLLRSLFGSAERAAVENEPAVALQPAGVKPASIPENETVAPPPSNGVAVAPPITHVVPESTSSVIGAAGEPKKPQQPAFPIDSKPAANPPATPEAALTSARPTNNGNKASLGNTSNALSSDVGRYLSDNQVALRYDEASSEWLRLPVRAVIRAGDRILTPPAYRGKFLIGGLQVTLEGGSQVVFGGGGAGNAPQIRIDYGRGQLFPLAAEKAVAIVDLDGRVGQVGFENVDSIFGFEVWREHAPGDDPELTAAIRKIDIFATLGAVNWQGDDGETVTLDATNSYSFRGEGEGRTKTLTQLPNWIEGSIARNSDRRAAEALEAIIAFDRPVLLSMSEAAEDRRGEVRSLAVRGLCHLGNFEGLVNAFGDNIQHAAWPSLLQAAHRALARRPANATTLRQTWERQHGNSDGQRMYRLLWGYSPEQLKESAPQLVGLLEHKMLAYRVLASENLQEITGTTLNYRAAQTASHRRTAANRWKARLEKGEIISH